MFIVYLKLEARLPTCGISSWETLINMATVYNAIKLHPGCNKVINCYRRLVPIDQKGS